MNLLNLLPAFTGGLGVVTVSGEALSDTDSGGAYSGVIFKADGRVFGIEGAITGPGGAQIDNATDWIIPNSKANSGYEVRYTGLTGDAFTTAAAAEDVWIDLSADREWTVTIAGPGSSSTSCTFEIRRGGDTLDSATYTFTNSASP